MQVSQERLERVKKEIVELLIDRLSHNLVDKKRASIISKMVLEKFKTVTQDKDIDHILESLTREFQEISIVIAQEKQHKETYAKQVTEKYISQLIKEGKIKLANEVMQKTMQGQVPPVLD